VIVKGKPPETLGAPARAAALANVGVAVRDWLHRKYAADSKPALFQSRVPESRQPASRVARIMKEIALTALAGTLRRHGPFG